MGDNKISEAVRKLAYETGMWYSQNEKCQPGVPFYAFTQGELDRFVEKLSNLQGEAVPVAWFTEDYLTDRSATTYDPVVAERWRAKGWPVSPLFAHPQPAELSEGSGDDGFPKVLVSQEFKHQAEYDAKELSAVENLLRNNQIGLSGSCSEMVAKLLALAATGKQQVDPEWSLHDRVEFALRDAGFGLDEAFRLAALVDGKQQVGEVQVDARLNLQRYSPDPENTEYGWMQGMKEDTAMGEWVHIEDVRAIASRQPEVK